MRIKDFLYWILNTNGEPFTGNQNTGQVIAGSKDTLLGPDGEPAFLKKTPDGWKDVLVKYGRNAKYWGLFRDFTVPMKFVKDGGLILRDIFWRKGIEGYAKLVIHKNDRSIWPERQKTWYTGEIDFSKIKQGKNSEVTVNVMEGGLSKLLKSNENKVYPIPIDIDPEHKNVLLDGLRLFCTLRYSFFFNSAHHDNVHLAPTVFLTNEGPRFFPVNEDVIFGNQVSGTWYETSSDWLVKFTKETNIRVRGTVKIFPNALDSDGVFELKLRTSTNRFLMLVTGGPFNTVGVLEYSFSFDETFTILENENLFLEAFYSADSFVTYADNEEFTIEFASIFDPTYAKGLYPFRLGEKIVEKMTDGKYGFKSDWLTAKKDIIHLSGDSIRQIETVFDGSGSVISKGAEIKTSLTDLFKALGFWMAGLGIENDKIVIEPLPYFFRSTIAFDLGLVDDCEFIPAEDLLCNSIKAGYKNQEYNDVNGKSEFNQGQLYSTPVTRITKELDITSPYRADPYGIEFTRINLDGKKTTDDAGDNDTFNLNVEETQNVDSDGLIYFKLNRPVYDSITGIPDPETIFNTELSPKRGLRNNGPLIRSIHHQLDAANVSLLSADKNTELTTGLAGVIISEKASAEISTLGDRLFLPYYATFTTSVPINLQQLMKDDPYGQIAFTWKGTVWYGYLWDGGIKPAINDKQQWKLLLSPNNDVTKLINV